MGPILYLFHYSSFNFRNNIIIFFNKVRLGAAEADVFYKSHLFLRIVIALLKYPVYCTIYFSNNDLYQRQLGICYVFPVIHIIPLFHRYVSGRPMRPGRS
jgi:hypothetical protein